MSVDWTTGVKVTDLLRAGRDIVATVALAIIAYSLVFKQAETLASQARTMEGMSGKLDRLIDLYRK